ncbi:MAG: LapA family protein [Spirochaetales bacterium]|nr:MAG: LapA family protein [Spirochaetales bacterium]
MKILYLVLILIVAIFAVMFAAQNSAQIAITFFSWSTSGSLSLVLILTFSIGIFLGVLIMAPSVFKRSFQYSGLKRRFKRLEKEKIVLNDKVNENKENCAEAAPTAEPVKNKPDKKPKE